jgi:TetR/AcrR family transcriptional regulator
LLNGKQVSNVAELQDRERNPDRTREAILDAAERLFADQGYDATSLSRVGQAAGVSRGTPGYFFGSKADLYRAVLERSFGEVRRAVASGRARALASGEAPEVVLAGAVGEYFDFLAARPSFIRLLERQALGTGNAALPGADHLEAGREALAALAQELGLDPAPSGDAAQLLLSIVSLCWFPLVHASTVAAAVGVALDDAPAREGRKRHVIELVLYGVHGRTPALAHTGADRREPRYP